MTKRASLKKDVYTKSEEELAKLPKLYRERYEKALGLMQKAARVNQLLAKHRDVTVPVAPEDAKWLMELLLSEMAKCTLNDFLMHASVNNLSIALTSEAERIMPKWQRYYPNGTIRSTDTDGDPDENLRRKGEHYACTTADGSEADASVEALFEEVRKSEEAAKLADLKSSGEIEYRGTAVYVLREARS